jgi:hypothetical protein
LAARAKRRLNVLRAKQKQRFSLAGKNKMHQNGRWKGTARLSGKNA